MSTKKYNDYSEKTQKFMSAVEKHLEDKFGGIEAQWEGMLQNLAVFYELFWQCKDTIKEQGLLVPNRFGGMQKNDLIKTMTDAQIQLIKLASEFGITPKSVKNLEITSNEDEDFIESLTK